MIELLSRDIMSVHWNRAPTAATHCDCAGLEDGSDVSTPEQRLRFFDILENHATCGALLTAAQELADPRLLRPAFTTSCWMRAAPGVARISAPLI